MRHSIQDLDHDGRWEHNLEALRRFRPELHEQVRRHRCSPVGDFIRTSSGLISLQFHGTNNVPIRAYDSDDPWKDAAIHFQTVPPDADGLVVFVGLGLGYGPLLVLEKRPNISKMVILEPSMDLFCTALKALDLYPLISSENVEFFVGDLDPGLFERHVSRLAAMKDTHILRHVPSFQWQIERYSILNDQVFMLINQINAQGGTTRKHGPAFFRNRMANLALIRHSHSLDLLRDRFHRKPAILVAAGPSLDQSIPALKKAVGRCVLIAADSALAPLLAAGIMPDFVTSIDFQDLNFEKLAPFLRGRWPFSLVASIKGTPFIPKRFPARSLFFAFPEDRPHSWVLEALGIKTPVPGALSVVHLSLGLALFLGADPICFVGQDLAYTAEQSDHAAGTIFTGAGLSTEREILYARGVHGTNVPTSRSFLASKKLFEDIISKERRTYLNASAGAHIEGTEVVSLVVVVDEHMQDPLSVQQLVGEAIRAAGTFPVTELRKTCLEILAPIPNVIRKLEEAIELSRQSAHRIDELSRKGVCAQTIDELPRPLFRRLKRLDRLNNALDAQGTLWEQVIELTFQALREDEDRRRENKRLRHSGGYIRWLQSELGRIGSVNKVRFEALMTFQRSLKNLVAHLGREETLLAGLSHDENTRDLLSLARLHLTADHFLLAKEILSRLLSQSPGHVEANVLMGEACGGLLDFEMARQYWRTALGKEPNLRSAIVSIRRKLAEPWIAVAQESGDTYPHLFHGWLTRIVALLEEDEENPPTLQRLWDGSRSKIERSLAENGVDSADRVLGLWETAAARFPEIHYLKACCLSAADDRTSALKEMDAALENEPQNARWLAFAARLLLESGRFDEGFERLREAVAIDPQTALLWEEVGDHLLSSGDCSSASVAYEHCFVALPNRTDVLRKIGDCYLFNREAQPARAAYEAVLAKEPGNEMARQRLEKAEQMDRLLHAGSVSSD
jgi:Flp pilus assembly protein TadD